jgi:acyl dehydratase
MATEVVISDEMRAQIGKESPPWTYEVTTTSVRAFARGVGYTDPVYYDVEAAKRAGYRNLPAPPTYLGTPVFIPGQSHDIFSGPTATGPRLDHGLKNLLDGGTETEYLEQICAGDTLTATSSLKALDVRESKALGKMLITTNETRYVNQHGKTVAIQRGQAIFY